MTLIDCVHEYRLFFAPNFHHYGSTLFPVCCSIDQNIGEQLVQSDVVERPSEVASSMELVIGTGMGRARIANRPFTDFFHIDGAKNDRIRTTNATS